MKFRVVNSATGHEVDKRVLAYEARKEWAAELRWQDTLTFALTESGELYLLDSRGHSVEAPPGFLAVVSLDTP